MDKKRKREDDAFRSLTFGVRFDKGEHAKEMKTFQVFSKTFREKRRKKRRRKKREKRKREKKKWF